jgi:ribonuclease HI
LQAGPFEEELAGLLARWQTQTRKLAEPKLQYQQGKAPAELVETLHTALGVDTELFASPLNVHPSMPAYLSTHPRDQLFGAGVDAYQHRWAGVSFAHPPEEREEMEKAVRWALANAKEADRHTPVLTVMLLANRGENAPYERWLQYPEVVELAEFEPGDLRREDANNWQGTRKYYPISQGAKAGSCTGYRLVAVCNATGRQHLDGKMQTSQAALDALPMRLGMCWPLGHENGYIMFQPWPWTGWRRRDRPAGQQYTVLQFDWRRYQEATQKHADECSKRADELRSQYKPPRKLTLASGDTSRLWRMPPAWVASDESLAEQRMTALYGQGGHVLQYDWQLAYFTDGSVQSTDDATLVGAAVWRAAWQTARLVKVNGSGPDNTITRAELAAIYHAVKEMDAGEDGLVFTDSLAAIHLLRRAVTEPHTLSNHMHCHLHAQLLLQTAELLVQRANAGSRTRIFKVKAHSGIQGNEEADKGAKEAGHPDADHDYDTSSHVPFAGRYRPAFYSQEGGEHEDAPAPQTVANLGSALTASIHPHCKTGNSRQGTYATSTALMYDGLDDDHALGHESNAYMTSQRVPQGARRTAFKHRTGQWYDKKKAWLRGAQYCGQPAATGMCPLCAEAEDSSGHLLLECSHRQVKAMQIKRHDSAVRAINKALQRQSKTGAAFTIMDACKAAELAVHGADAKRVLRWMLPTDTISDVDLAKMRPDILRVVGLPAAPTDEQLREAADVANRGKYHIQLIEVGYCSDTKWRDKVKEKLKQHERLVAALQEAGWRIDDTPHIIVLGAAGAVYMSGLEALRKLGLTEKHGRALLTKLHLDTVQAAHNISLARRRLERPHHAAGVG